jgi:hypothetical protein
MYTVHCTVGGLQFYTFSNFKRIQTENYNFWQNNKILLFANCLKMYRFLMFAKRREDFCLQYTYMCIVQYKTDEWRFFPCNETVFSESPMTRKYRSSLTKTSVLGYPYPPPHPPIPNLIHPYRCV